MRSTLKYDIIIQNCWGACFMKTKIIYISGSEVFEMTDIRAAFEEVRGTLGLGSDTVLFGVPVDSDSMNENKNSAATPTCAIDTPNTITDEQSEQVTDATPTDIPNNIDIIDTDIKTDDRPADMPEKNIPAADIEPAAPVKKTRGRPRKTAPVVQEAAPAPEMETKPAETKTDEPAEKVIPILSVLASGGNNATAQPAETVTEDLADEISDAGTSDAEQDTIIESVAEESENIVIGDEPAEDISLADMIDDNAPAAAAEKTLEQLLESMAPLREDHGDANLHAPADAVPMDIDTADADTSDDADATLEQLAAEFADTADEIPVAPATTGQGKIGKLKNILPFKKARREDTGLMGDLFGWAGVAANDEDFSIPGFFTTSASKK